jgi:hypothetical protein
MAVVSGDPGKAAEFVIQLSMPAGYKIAPHFHPTDKTGPTIVSVGEGDGSVCADIRQPG